MLRARRRAGGEDIADQGNRISDGDLSAAIGVADFKRFRRGALGKDVGDERNGVADRDEAVRIEVTTLLSDDDDATGDRERLPVEVQAGNGIDAHLTAGE